MPLNYYSLAKVKNFILLSQYMCELEHQKSSAKISQNIPRTNDSEKKEITLNKDETRPFIFEQAFMKKNIQTFNFFAQRYIENTLLVINHQGNFINRLIFSEKQIFNSQSTQVREYLFWHESLLDYDKAYSFMQYLQNQEQLHAYLNYVCYNSCDGIAIQLLYLAANLWLLFKRQNLYEFDFQQLIQCAKKSMEKIMESIYNAQFKYLTFQQTLIKSPISKDDRKKHLYEFVQYFAITFFLIASQFLQNPFFQKMYDLKFQSCLLMNKRISSQVDQGQSSDDNMQFIFSFKKKNKY